MNEFLGHLFLVFLIWLGLILFVKPFRELNKKILKKAEELSQKKEREEFIKKEDIKQI